MSKPHRPSEDPDASERRRMILALVAGLGIVPEAGAQDAATVQPGAYRVVLDNEFVRVIELHSRPTLGVCGVGMHSHPPHLTVALSPAKVRVKTRDGKTFVGENQLGDVFWSDAETHETENISGKDVRALLVEVKPAAARKG